MARDHARIMLGIWRDQDFLALDRSAQGTYCFLISQPDLSFAGAVHLRIRPWTTKAAGLTAKQLRADLDALAERRFIVMDEDTEEVLVRSYVRHSGGWKLPKVMVRIKEEGLLIESPTLRRALARELSRLPLEDLPNEPTATGVPPSRQVAAAVVHELSEGFTEEANPPETTPGKPLPQGLDEPLEQGSVRTRAPVLSSSLAVSSYALPVVSEPTKPARKRACPLPDDFQPTDRMISWAHATHGLEAQAVTRETEQFRDHHLARASTFHDWNAAWRTWMKNAADFRKKRGWSGSQPAPITSTTDRKVAAVDDAVASLKARLSGSGGTPPMLGGAA